MHPRARVSTNRRGNMLVIRFMFSYIYGEITIMNFTAMKSPHGMLQSYVPQVKTVLQGLLSLCPLLMLLLAVSWASSQPHSSMTDSWTEIFNECMFLESCSDLSQRPGHHAAGVHWV